jgi:3-methylcrotonyl-CoA carboxylase alpha subunit
LTVTIDGVTCEAHVVRRPERLDVFFGGKHYGLERHADVISEAADVDSGRITAPMPGKITSVSVKAGDEVNRGAVLLVLEAMKMEHVIAASASGRVTRLHVAVGAQVGRGAPLVDLEAPAGPETHDDLDRTGEDD